MVNKTQLKVINITSSFEEFPDLAWKTILDENYAYGQVN